MLGCGCIKAHSYLTSRKLPLITETLPGFNSIKLRLNSDKTEERFILPMKDQVHNLGGLLDLVLSLNLQMARAFSQLHLMIHM